jgi:mannose-6-phosphate isomerase-like protein (cupin superfamily)
MNRDTRSDRLVRTRSKPIPQPSSVIDLDRLLSDVTDAWKSFDLAVVNTNTVRLRVMNDMTANWHVHERSDELFYVLSGAVHMDTDRGAYAIRARQLFIVPAGLRHRARVDGQATMLIIDKIR